MSSYGPLGSSAQALTQWPHYQQIAPKRSSSNADWLTNSELSQESLNGDPVLAAFALVASSARSPTALKDQLAMVYMKKGMKQVDTASSQPAHMLTSLDNEALATNCLLQGQLAGVEELVSRLNKLHTHVEQWFLREEAPQPLESLSLRISSLIGDLGSKYARFQRDVEQLKRSPTYTQLQDEDNRFEAFETDIQTKMRLAVCLGFQGVRVADAPQRNPVLGSLRGKLRAFDLLQLRLARLAQRVNCLACSFDVLKPQWEGRESCNDLNPRSDFERNLKGCFVDGRW